jgi:hypothetical protein
VAAGTLVESYSKVLPDSEEERNELAALSRRALPILERTIDLNDIFEGRMRSTEITEECIVMRKGRC